MRAEKFEADMDKVSLLGLHVSQPMFQVWTWQHATMKMTSGKTCQPGKNWQTQLFPAEHLNIKKNDRRYITSLNPLTAEEYSCLCACVCERDCDCDNSIPVQHARVVPYWCHYPCWKSPPERIKPRFIRCLKKSAYPAAWWLPKPAVRAQMPQQLRVRTSRSLPKLPVWNAGSRSFVK